MVQNRSEPFGTGLKAEPNPWNQCILVQSGSVTFVVWFQFELVLNQTMATLDVLNTRPVPDWVNELTGDPVDLNNGQIPLSCVSSANWAPPDHENEQEAKPSFLSWDSKLANFNCIISSTREKPSIVSICASGRVETHPPRLEVAGNAGGCITDESWVEYCLQVTPPASYSKQKWDSDRSETDDNDSTTKPPPVKLQCLFLPSDVPPNIHAMCHPGLNNIKEQLCKAQCGAALGQVQTRLYIKSGLVTYKQHKGS